MTQPRALSNALSIGTQPSALSQALKAHALEAGWNDGDGRFDFSGRLIDEAKDLISFGRGRCARAQKLLGEGAGDLDVRVLMQILRDHGPEAQDGAWSPERTQNRTICMHAGADLRRSQTVASLVAEIGEGGAVCWATASAAPCLSLFKPVLTSTRPAPVAPPSAAPDLGDRWWIHERFHRRALEDFPSILAAIKQERDAVEHGFVQAVQAAEGAVQSIDKRWSINVGAKRRRRETLAVGAGRAIEGRSLPQRSTEVGGALISTPAFACEARWLSSR